MYINKVIATAILGFSLSAFALEQAPNPARGQLLRDERKLEHDLRKSLAHARPGRPFRRSEPLAAQLADEEFDDLAVDRATEAKGRGLRGKGKLGKGKLGKGKGKLAVRAEEIEDLELLDEEDFESVDRAAEAKGRGLRGKGKLGKGKGKLGKGKGKLAARAEEIEDLELLDEEDFESVDRAAEAKGRGLRGKGKLGKGKGKLGKAKGKVARRNEGSEMAELDLDEEEIGDVVANINAKGFGRLGKIGAVKGLAGKGKLGGKLGGKGGKLGGKLGKGKGKA